MSLSEKINNCVEESILNFIRLICNKYQNTSEQTLLLLWKNKDVSSLATSGSAVTVSDNICTHRYTKGNLVGQRCTNKMREGETKCSKHRVRSKTGQNTVEERKLLDNLKELQLGQLENSDSDDED